MTINVDIRTRAWQAALACSALLLGLLCAYQPKYAAVAIVSGIVVALALSDLAVGLCVFTLVAFLDVLPAYSGSLSVTKVIGLLLALGWLRNIAIHPQRRRLLDREPLLVAVMLALAGWTLLSALWAEQSSSWFDASQSWLLDLALFAIVFAAVRERRHVTWLFVAFIAGALVAAAYGLVAAPPPAVGDRLSGALGPNGLGNTMTVAIVLAASLGARHDWTRAKRALAFAAAGICMIILFLTVSREAMVGLGAALILTPLVVNRQQRAKAVGLVVAGIAVAAVYLALFAPSALSRFTTTDPTGSGRTDIWTVGWRMVQAHPIQGVGAGNFPVASVHFLLEPGTITFSRYIVDQPKVAHNIYLEALAELGIVGLLGFLAIVAICVGCAARAARLFSQNGDPDGATMARGLLIGLIAILVSEFFGSGLFLKELWLLLAMGPALAAVAAGGGSRAVPLPGVTRDPDERVRAVPPSAPL